MVSPDDAVDWRLLVQVVVPTGNNKANIATGYPIADNRIVTVGHVLDGQVDKPALVCWSCLGDNHAQSHVQAIEWDGRKENIDIVVLRCDFPESISVLAPFSSQVPGNGIKWAGKGFAKAGDRVEGREPIGLYGTVIPSSEIGNQICLGCDYTIASEEDWRGGSGSPVFVQGKLAAIVVQYPEKFEARRLFAIPVSYLLEFAHFRESIRCTVSESELKRIGEKRGRRVKQRIAEIINADDIAANVILAGLHDQDAKQQIDKQNRAETIADTLLHCRPEQLVLLLDDCHRDLVEDNEIESAKSIVHLGELVLPVITDEAVVLSAQGRIDDDCSAIIRIQASSKTMAELFMASVGPRGAELMINPEKAVDLPFGVRELDHRMLNVAEKGREHTAEDSANTVISHLANKYALVPSELAGRNIDPETMLKLIDEELLYRRGKGEGHYFAFYLPTDNDERQARIDLINKLKKKLRGLIFICLSDDGELILKESRCFRPLREMLRRAIKG